MMDIFKLDFNELKKKINADPMASDMYQRAISYADSALEFELPDEPVQDTYDGPCKVDGRFSLDWIEQLYKFDKVSWLFERSFTALAFAYKMTGKTSYLDKWIACVDSCFINPAWGPKVPYLSGKYDHCSSRLSRALPIATAWLQNDLTDEILDRIDERLGIEIDGFIETYARSGDLYPLGPNDHQSKAIAGAGMSALYLTGRGSKGREADLERLIYLFEKLLPETVTPEGGWIDGYDFYYYAMMDCVFFLDTLKAHTGQDLIFYPGMREAAQHSLYGLGAHKGFAASSPYVFFWTADRYNMPEALRVPEYMLKHGTFEDMHAPYAFIFYNPDLPVEHLKKTVNIAQDFGLGRIGRGFGDDGVYLWMKSGPAEAFCRNNQNGIQLSAFGKRLLYNTVLQPGDPSRLWDTVFKYGLWLTGKSNSIIVNGQDQLKNLYGEDWEPIKKFHKPGRPKWDDDTMWWFDYEEPKESFGRFIGASDTGDAQFMSASADTVFGPEISRYTRHCAVLGQNLIVIADCLQAEDGAETIAFRGNTPCKITQNDGQIDLNADEEAYATLSFTATSDLEITNDVWEFQPETGGYFTAELKAKKGLNILITVIQCSKSTIADQNKINLTEQNGKWQIKIIRDKDEYELSLPENLFDGLLNLHS